MSCASLRKKFEDEKRKGLSFQKAVELLQDVQGSVDAHRTELEELKRISGSQEDIRHLEHHIAEGEALIRELHSLKLT